MTRVRRLLASAFESGIVAKSDGSHAFVLSCNSATFCFAAAHRRQHRKWHHAAHALVWSLDTRPCDLLAAARAKQGGETSATFFLSAEGPLCSEALNCKDSETNSPPGRITCMVSIAELSCYVIAQRNCLTEKTSDCTTRRLKSKEQTTALRELGALGLRKAREGPQSAGSHRAEN